MSDSGDITHLIDRLKAGDRAAAQPLWETYFRRLVGLARHKLRGTPRQAADEEDVALSAFDSFCRAAERGNFPRLDDRRDLWQILMVITVRKAFDLAQYERRRRPAGGAVLGDAELIKSADGAFPEEGLAGILSREPTPAFAAQVAEQCERLLERLGNDELRSVARWKLEGYTVSQMAAMLNVTTRTIERKLRMIRRMWTQEAAGQPKPSSREE
jgi:DNA-directed RNA polymerase specialized sigma24 family protein